MKIVRQLIKEFWIPGLIGILWTLYSIYEGSFDNLTVRSFVNIFGPTFFFVSWLVSQWYRVRKQQKVEDGLQGIEGNVKQMLAQLDEKTSDLVAYITGGRSVCYLSAPIDGNDAINYMMLIHHGDHPLYNVVLRVVDVEDFDRNKDNWSLRDISKSEFVRECGDLIPQHASPVDLQFSLGDGDSRNFNIFFSARNGTFAQLLRLRRVNGKWLSATMVDVMGDVRYEEIDEGFPRNSKNEVDW